MKQSTTSTAEARVGNNESNTPADAVQIDERPLSADPSDDASETDLKNEGKK